MAIGITALFEADVAGDYYTAPDTLRLWLSQSGLGLPDPDYYGDDDVEKVYREVLRSALENIYGSIRNKEADADEDVYKKHKKPKKGSPAHFDYRKVLDFERRLAKIYVDR